MKSKGGTLGKCTSNGILITVWDPGFEVFLVSPDYCSELKLNIRGGILLPSSLTGEMQSCLWDQIVKISEGLEVSAVT